jgi:hypothetical protein
LENFIEQFIKKNNMSGYYAKDKLKDYLDALQKKQIELQCQQNV